MGILFPYFSFTLHLIIFPYSLPSFLLYPTPYSLPSLVIHFPQFFFTFHLIPSLISPLPSIPHFSLHSTSFLLYPPPQSIPHFSFTLHLIPLLPYITIFGHEADFLFIVPIKKIYNYYLFRYDDFGVQCLQWHPTQPWLLSSGADGYIKLWT